MRSSCETGVEWGVDLPTDSPLVRHALLLGLEVDRLDVAAATDAATAWETVIRSCQAAQAKVVAHLARMHGGSTPSHDGPDPDAPDSARRSWEKAVIGSRLGIGDGPARTLVATATALDEQLPAMADALATGGVSWQHCANVAREVRALTAVDAGRVERRILADRRQVTAHQYALRAHALAAELLTAPPEPVTPPVGLRAWNNAFGGVDLAGSFTPTVAGSSAPPSTSSPPARCPATTGPSRSAAPTRWCRSAPTGSAVAPPRQPTTSRHRLADPDARRSRSPSTSGSTGSAAARPTSRSRCAAAAASAPGSSSARPPGG